MIMINIDNGIQLSDCIQNSKQQNLAFYDNLDGT